MGSKFAAGLSRARIAALLVTLAVVGASAVPTYAVASRTPVGSVVAHAGRGKFLGVVRSRRGAQRAVRASTQPLMIYDGGPVQHSSAVYAIFWVPGSYALPPGYTDLVSQYFTDVAHDSFQVSNVYASDTQYYDVTRGVKRFVSYAGSYGGAIMDSHPLPADGCPNYRLFDRSMSTNCITDAQIEAEILSVVAAHHLRSGLNTEYFVFTPQGLATCDDTSALKRGGCYDPLNFDGYCAYHSSTNTSPSAVLYATMPYAAIEGCSSDQSPNANPADSVLNGVSHEHNETITDPLGNAWGDRAGNENGDKCRDSYGPPIGATNSGAFNQVINGHGYWLQEEWSNRTRSCVARNTFPQPSVSFADAPVSPVHGSTVRFAAIAHDGDDTTLSYRWTFPNGTVSNLPNPIYRFQAAGLKQVVLVVTDPHGDQTRAVQAITVT